ncbi:hypothetical protein [Pseudalkalibacillus decolorationis]|uniref:hypothetical protein n=1 Tax=Pseudalkalibacillus decolorationis TaxID=163879 RepID=UPI00214724AE|nr:hypothetical protein [Pseudalkalibacillus decolorationis]
MYERYKDVENVYQTLLRLERTIGEQECYSQSCETIRNQLQQAIAFETGQNRGLSRYSSLYPQ